MSEQATLTIDAILDGRYRLVSEGQPQDLGVAFRAYDLQEDRLVDLLVISARWGSGQEALNRLQQAEEAVRSLSSPSLIPHEHTGLAGEQEVYVVCPHVARETLADLLARDGIMDEKAAVETTIRLCEALAPAHRAGLTHGSLSTHAVVLGSPAAPDGSSATEIALLDTGLLPALRPTGTPNEGPWGRMPYISPEQAAGNDVQPASDVYVIGSLLYEMLIGRPPFRAADEAVLALQHRHQEPPSLQIMDTRISKTLAQIVYRTLAKEPSTRYRNAEQLAHILRAQLGPKPDPARIRESQMTVPPPPPRPMPATADTWSSAEPQGLDVDRARSQPSQRIDWAIIVLLIAALIAVLGLILLWNTVYNRYAGTTVGSLPTWTQVDAEPDARLLDGHHPGNLSECNAELERRAVFCYNGNVQITLSLVPQQRNSLRIGDLRGHVRKSPAFGTQLTGLGEKA